MSQTDLMSRVCETINRFLALGCERFQLCGATFIRNYAAPSRYDANNIGLIRDAGLTEELLARADIEYGHLAFRQFNIDPLTPSQIEARLALAGFGRWSEHLVMVLEGNLHSRPNACDIRLVRTDEEWLAYHELTVVNVREYSERTGQAEEPEEVLRDLLTYVRGKSSKAPTWMAYVDNVPQAYLTSWSGNCGIGQIEDLFTHPDYRHRGLATALIAHGIESARAGGASEVLVIADPSDTPKEMYASMGFAPLFISRSQYR